MKRLMTAMAVVFLFASACGDDSSLTDAIEAGNSSGGTGGDSGGSGDGGGDSGGSGDDGGDVGIGSNTDFCRFNDEINTGIDDVDIFGDPASLEAAFGQVINDIDRAVGLAPDQIRGDVQVLAEGFKGFADIMRDYDYNILSIPEDMTSDPRFTALEDPRYEEAGNRVDAFCGFEDEPADDTGGVEDTPDPALPDDQMRDIVIQGLQASFGWDDQLAACVVDELGLDDPTAIDPSVFGDPNGEVCGRSFTELFGG